MTDTQEHDLEQQRTFLARLRNIQGFPRDSGEVTTELNVLDRIRRLEAALGLEVTPELTDAESLANQLSALRNAFNVSRNKQTRAGLRAQIRELRGQEPEVPDDDDCFIFANIFRMQGSTAQGAPPQEKVLVSSGKISCESADALKATGHIIEEIAEGDVSPPEIGPVTPQNPFYIKNGVKVFLNENVDGKGKTIRIEITESLGFREIA